MVSGTSSNHEDETRAHRGGTPREDRGSLEKGDKGTARSSGDVITVASWEVLAKILSPVRLEMLARIPEIEVDFRRGASA